MNTNPLVVYHSPCLDGFTAAWACWLECPDAEFVAGVYGEPPPDCTGRKVYLLDFSYKLNVMEQIINQAEHVTILDHHKSAEKDLSNLWSVQPHGIVRANCDCIFDMEKSGARLAWEWFHPGTDVPLFVKLVEDRDLWRFAIQGSKELNTYFFSFDYDFKVWSDLRNDLDVVLFRDEMFAAGVAIERKHMKDVRELVEKVRHERAFTRGTGLLAPLVPCANLPYTMSSDAAGLMAQDAPFAATYYQDAAGDFVFSLRSREDGVDVSEIAVRYGGGGHKHAAGFRVKSLEEL